MLMQQWYLRVCEAIIVLDALNILSSLWNGHQIVLMYQRAHTAMPEHSTIVHATAVTSMLETLALMIVMRVICAPRRAPTPR